MADNRPLGLDQIIPADIGQLHILPLLVLQLVVEREEADSKVDLDGQEDHLGYLGHLGEDHLGV